MARTMLNDEQWQKLSGILRQINIEPPRDCRRPNILREYDNENTTLYS